MVEVVKGGRWVDVQQRLVLVPPPSTCEHCDLLAPVRTPGGQDADFEIPHLKHHATHLREVELVHLSPTPGLANAQVFQEFSCAKCARVTILPAATWGYLQVNPSKEVRQVLSSFPPLLVNELLFCRCGTNWKCWNSDNNCFSMLQSAHKLGLRRSLRPGSDKMLGQRPCPKAPLRTRPMQQLQPTILPIVPSPRSHTVNVGRCSAVLVVIIHTCLWTVPQQSTKLPPAAFKGKSGTSLTLFTDLLSDARKHKTKMSMTQTGAYLIRGVS